MHEKNAMSNVTDYARNHFRKTELLTIVQQYRILNLAYTSECRVS